MPQFLQPCSNSKSSIAFVGADKQNLIARGASAVLVEFAGCGERIGMLTRVPFCGHTLCHGPQRLFCQAAVLQTYILHMFRETSGFAYKGCSQYAGFVRVFLGHGGPELTPCNPESTNDLAAVQAAWTSLSTAMQATLRTTEQPDNLDNLVVLSVAQYSEVQVAKHDVFLQRRASDGAFQRLFNKTGFNCLPVHMRSNLEVAMFAASCDTSMNICDYLQGDLQNCVELMKAMLSTDVARYRNMTNSMQRNEDVCLHAMHCDLAWCVKTLDNTYFSPSFLIKAAGSLQQTCSWFPIIATSWFPSIATPEGTLFWTQAVALQPMLLKLICSMNGADGSGVIDTELQRNGVSLQFADKQTQRNFSKAMLAVTQNESAIDFVDESIREAVAACVQENKSLLASSTRLS
jgi:hypothetical protein